MSNEPISFEPPRGMRDFYPEDMAWRNRVFDAWRQAATISGFAPYDACVVENLALLQRKAGEEVSEQIYTFQDKSERWLALRPEMTPTLARMIIARERDFKKPIKWFCTPQFFRYEKQQKGRLREFGQLNCDLLGESSVAADAEMVALTIDMLRAFGLSGEDFVVRVSDRDAWKAFLDAHGSFDEAGLAAFLQIVDKIERNKPEVTEAALKPFGICLEEVRAFIAHPGTHFERFNALAAELDARGLKGFYQLDPTIVRGLAYYTGLVFEVFDRKKTLRAVAGGGRYDNLMNAMSDGKVTLPAIGFGMGDVVLGELIDATPAAAEKMKAWIAQRHAADVYVIIANETRRVDALGLVQQLRGLGFRVDYPLSAAKVGKQFQAAEQAGARCALVIGDEWPQLKMKILATREELLVNLDELPVRLAS